MGRKWERDDPISLSEEHQLVNSHGVVEVGFAAVDQHSIAHLYWGSVAWGDSPSRFDPTRCQKPCKLPVEHLYHPRVSAFL